MSNVHFINFGTCLSIFCSSDVELQSAALLQELLEDSEKV